MSAGATDYTVSNYITDMVAAKAPLTAMGGGIYQQFNIDTDWHGVTDARRKSESAGITDREVFVVLSNEGGAE